MKVRAINKGFYGNRLRSPGEVFEVKDDEKAGWFEPVKIAPPEEVKEEIPPLPPSATTKAAKK